MTSTCAACGVEQPDGARFCFSCGTALRAPECPACGTELVPGARFCSGCGAAQGGPPVGQVTAAAVASRRVTSVMFGDLVGFTSLAENRDQEEVRELLSRYFEECRQVIARYGGTVEKFIGDAVMAVWGVPAAHEDDAERSVRAGLELVNGVAALGEDVGLPGLAVRVGIVTGEVAVTVGATHEGMVAGDAVNTAARIQGAAEPGQVWVDETTRLLTSSAITYVDVGSHQVKGKADPLPLWAVRAVVAARGGAQRADGLEAPLVGRERELRLVKELFHVTEDSGRPSLVVIDGDPGVGKSRLAWEFEKYVDGLQTAVRWHTGRCLAYGEGVAFYALAEAIRGRLAAVAPDDDDDREAGAEQLLDAGLESIVSDPDERAWLRPRLAALLGTASVGTYAREDLFSAWTTFLERVGGGEEIVVLVIDDAQHADGGLLEFVEHVLAVGTFPFLVVLVTRAGLLDEHPALATNRHATVVHLPALSTADMSELLSGLVAGLPDPVRARLVERAEGVPLFAVETVRSLIDRDLVVPRGGQYVLAEDGDLDLDRIGAPASLQALIGARLDTLSHEQREVVNRASILGDSFRVEEIAALCPDLTDIDRVLRELVRLQILSVMASRLSSEYGYFSFVQSVVRQVASAMLSRRDRKATHLAVLELLLAENDPAGDLAPIIAQHYLDALAALPSDPDAEALRRSAIAQLERAASRAGALGSPAEAAGHLSAALAQATDDATRARLQGDLAWSLMNAGQYGEALPHAAEATRIFDALGDPVAAGLAAAAHAQILGFEGDNEGALAVAEPRWAQLEGRRDADRSMMALGEALVSGTSRLSRDFREIAEKRLGIAERNGAYDVIADSMLALGVHYSNVGLTSLFRALNKAGADMARTQRRPAVLARALVNLTSDAINDELDEAVAYGQEALSVASGAGVAIYISFARMNLAIAFLERGDWSELDALLAPEAQESAHAPVYLATEIAIGEARSVPWEVPWTAADRPRFDDHALSAWQAHCEARSAYAAGRLAGAVALAMEAVDRTFEVAGLWDDLPFIWIAAAELVVEAGDALAHARLMELLGAEGDPLPRCLKGHRDRLRALWGARTGLEPRAVENHLRSAVDAYEVWGSSVHRAKAEVDLGLLLLGDGRTDEGTALVERARGVFTRLGAVTWLARLDERLAAVETAGVHPAG